MIEIIIPVYNEGGNIRKTLKQINEKISVNKKVKFIYDFDEDNTIPAIHEEKNKYDFEINLIKNSFGRGALNALKTGLISADEEFVLVMMADLSDDIEIVDKMYEKVNEGYDLVCASRYMKGGKQIGGPFLKKIFSRIAGVSLHYLINIPTHDVTNSFKLYKKELLDQIHIESTGGFELGMEIVVKAYNLGYKITELPSIWYDRVDGESNFKMWNWIPHYLKWYFWGVKNTWLKKNRSN